MNLLKKTQKIQFFFKMNITSQLTFKTTKCRGTKNVKNVYN